MKPAAVIATLCLLASPSFALDPRKAVTQYRRDTWTLAHGLPHSSINRLAQDTQGYLWLATFGGAMRFDGVRFEAVSRPDRPLEPIGDNVTDMLEDPEGVRWLGTSGGLLRLDRTSSRLFTENDGLPGNGVQTLALDANGRLLVGTGRGLAILDRQPPYALTRVDKIAGVDVTSFLRDRKGRLWVGTREGLHVRESTGSWRRLADPELGTLHIWSVVEDPSGTIWIATRLGGLQSWTEGRVRKYSRREGLAHDVVRSLLVDRDGILWIGTAGGGLNRLRHGRFERLSARDGSLPSDIVRALFEDREGNVWIGTAGGGLSRLSDLPITNITTREGLTDDSVWTATEDEAGMLWIGSNGGLVGLRGMRLERYNEAEGAQPIVLSLLATREGLLVGTYRGLFTLRAGRLIRLDRPGDLSNTVVRSLVETRGGAIWIGTERGAFEFRRGAKPAFRKPEGGPEANIPVIREARDGSLWLGLERGGLYRYASGEFVEQQWARPMGPIRDLYEDERGVLWIGGVGLGRSEQGRLVRFGSASGFAERRIHALLSDPLGNLWLSTNTGVYRVRREELDAFAKGSGTRPWFEPFREGEGLAAAEGNGGSQPAAWPARDGRLWFATIGGLTGIDPVAATRKEPQSVARIREALIDGGRVERGARLPLGARRIEFEYTALRLTSPQQLRFRYRLEPVDAEWSDAGARRSVAYASLSPGAYRFRVAAAGRDGAYVEDPAPFDFVVVPYLHERAAFRAAIAFLVILTILGGAALRVRALRRREVELERIVAEKTRDLERLASEDALTGLANRRHFDRELEREILRARRSMQPISLLMADVDNFKAFNDAYGHPKGDECLKRIADALRTHGRRAGDVAARLGGEEFALLLPEMEAALAATLAERLRIAVSEQRIPHQGTPLGYVTVSIGVSTVDSPRIDGVTPKDLVQEADWALYKAKAEGRDRVVVRPEGPGSEPAAS